MFSKISSNRLRVKEIPILYKKRQDPTKLNSLHDRIKIFKQWLFTG